jgi:hypothetical protein
MERFIFKLVLLVLTFTSLTLKASPICHQFSSVQDKDTLLDISNFLSNECSAMPLTFERVQKINALVVTMMRKIEIWPGDGNCSIASAIFSSVLDKLGYLRGKDYDLIDSPWHTYVYFPLHNLMADPTANQFFRGRSAYDELLGKGGFIGKPKEFIKLAAENSKASREIKDYWSLNSVTLEIIPDHTWRYDHALSLSRTILGSEEFLTPEIKRVQKIFPIELENGFGCKELSSVNR